MSFHSRSASIASERSTAASDYIPRTLEDVRENAAREVAMRATAHRRTVDGVRMGVLVVMAKADEVDFLARVADRIREEHLLKNEFVFAVATSGTPIRPNKTNTLMICGSPEHYVQRAVLLASSKLIGRVMGTTNEGHMWLASVKRITSSGPTSPSTDEAALWDVLVKSSRQPIDPLNRPPGCLSAATRLALAQSKLERLTPQMALNELRTPSGFRGVQAPTFLVDIRSLSERERSHGAGIHGSLTVERNQLEWLFDPQSEERLAIADRYDLRVILFDEDGRASSLAAVALQEIGLLNATDIVGGFRAWIEADLPGDITGMEDEDDLHSEPSVIQILG
ncbi:Rhodanese domain-containing protein [Mycena indigotica]|uniref:Rhodanese domain-containing protein n=1 Tax=Mycena indigotica TaxID=2126181 RepID=A0A8H6S0Y0_9AGAR|nr:Rhodanese domain-containing protein [Mycena indigotica]KAF7291290.1 Rhodanese domain-containing protein [Mycena indigotica]